MNKIMLKSPSGGPMRKDLRKFAFVCVIFFLCLFFYRAAVHPQASGFFLIGLASLFAVAGVFLPSILLYPYLLWMKFGSVMGAVNTMIIMFVLFYLVLTPIGVFLRFSGKNSIRKNWDKGYATYWIKRSSQPAHMRNQF